LVGSVVVDAVGVAGEGFHPGAGQPHAEVFAIRAAGDRTQGATLYVNLEPCNHTGRTPPCTEAIIAAGIQRVVVGIIDPDSRVSGAGIQRLRQAGIIVTVGVEATSCQRLNEVFIHSVENQRPFGILKYAMTLDGKIATTTGHSAWVSSPASRTWVHRLRGNCDAVIIGGATVRQDNPTLTTHGQSDRTPWRIVMSRQLNLPRHANLWDTHAAKTLVFCTEERDHTMKTYLEQQGVDVIALMSLTPRQVLTWLHQQEIRCVLWESGGQLSAQAIAEKCVQQVYAFIAPKIIGGRNAPTAIGDLDLTEMTAAIPLKEVQFQQVDTDLLVSGYLES
jgi:diaminohydroxyphosphoribosylaminopyrimidine deaminase/5-amino-6-(5-phosphoribosylamino)uracil reductase